MRIRPLSRSSLIVVLALLVLPLPLVSGHTLPGTDDPDEGANMAGLHDGDSGRQEGVPILGTSQGTLVRAVTAEPNSLDLPQTTERQAFTTAWQLYDSLVWVNDDNEIEPALAEDWDISEDGTEYTFYLRRGVTFHNDEPFNADAVVFSWERASQGDFERSFAWQQATSVAKSGEYTVTVTTEQPDGLFLRTVASDWAMIPPGYFQRVGQESFDAAPMGTGPYQFVEWVAGDHITFEANADYWRGAPKIQTVLFKPIPISTDRVTAIQTGTVDIVSRLSQEEAQSLAGMEGIKVVSYPVDRVYYIAFNNLTTGLGQPTMDARVRRAMNYAVDVGSIITLYFDGFARQSTGFVTRANVGYDNGKPFGHDLDTGRALLTEAGYPQGFAMDMACPLGAYPHFEQVCQSVADDLGDVGIDVTLVLSDSGEYWDLEAQKRLPPLFGDSWSAAGGEALRRLQGALGGWEAPYSAWSDPVIDGLLDALSVELDQEERAALYGQLQEYMRQDPPFIYLYEPLAFEAINVQVQDYRPRPSEDYFLMDTWLDVDGDGVAEDVEDGAPNSGDGNADGAPDRDQDHVASLPNAVDGRYVTLVSPQDTQISDVRTLVNPSPGDAPAPATFPFGFVAFEIVGIAPGSSVTVTLSLPPDPELGTYWRYGATPDDPSDHWYRFLYDGATGAEIIHELDRTRVILHLTDGIRGDGDLVRDGQIVDPGAPAVAPQTIYLPLIARRR